MFNYRPLFMLLMALATVVLGYMAVTRLELRPSFEKMIPQSQPYIQNFLENRQSLRGLGNSVRVVVENTQGDIFDPGYLDVLKQVNDQLFLTEGVDRAWMKSLWSPAVRWTEVTEEGFQGGPVMPDTYQGKPEEIEQLRQNISRAGIVGSLVASDYKSSMLIVPLLDKATASGQRIDYHAFSQMLEEQLRDKIEFAGDSAARKAGEEGKGQYKVRVIGFAKLMGDLIDGLIQVMMFFGLAVVTSLIIIYIYTRCVRSTLLVVGCSLIAVVWQLGIVAWLGYAIDPYSVLVPFLIFAIGVSHAAQKMNGIMQDIARGTHKLIAARYTFRRLFIAGVTALLADAVGFAVLMLIDIPVIRDLAITASIGVAVLIFTSLLLMPVALSYVGVGAKAAERALKIDTRAEGHKGFGKLWDLLDRFTTRKWATGAVLVALLMGIGGFMVSLQLKIGDLESGAPELRADSRYNRDNAYITSHYALSSDLFAVMIKTAPEGCLNYKTLILADRLAWELQQSPGVQATASLVNAVRQITAGTYEGNPKLNSIQRNQDVLNYAAQQASVNSPELFNNDCSLMPVIAFLKDHKAETLDAVVAIADKFARENSSRDRQFLLAAGSAGIEAATNIVVREANRTMLLYVYAAVTLVLPDHLPQLARHAGGLAAAGADLDPLRGLDGGHGHRREGRDPAGDRPRRRHRRRLRLVPAQRAAALPAPGPAAVPGLPQRRVVHRPGGGPGGHHPGRRRGVLGLVADQVPGGHGHPADLHVPVEHARRADPDPGPVVLPAASTPLRKPMWRKRHKTGTSQRPDMPHALTTSE